MLDHLLWQGHAGQVEHELSGDQSPLGLAFRRACATHDATALSFHRIPGDALSTLGRLCAVSWAGIPIHEAQQEALRSDIGTYRSGGYERAACELEAGLAIAQGRELTSAQRRTVTALFADEPAWQRAIEAIEAAAGEPQGAGTREDTRLVWIIQTVPAAGIHFEAREQKRGARGWSSGRLLSDPALAKGPPRTSVCLRPSAVATTPSIIPRIGCWMRRRQ